MKKLLIAGLAASALSGCVNLAPEHVRPEPAVPAGYDHAYRPDGTVVASRLGWREYLTDPRLQVLIASALENNRDLVAATARIEQARARYRIENADRLPQVVATGSATRTRIPLQTQPVGAGTPASGSVTIDRYDIGIGASAFELDFWGRVANQSEAARARYLSTVAAQRSFYLSLIADVATRYFELIESGEQIALAEQTVESRAEGLRIAALRLDAGVTSGLPYRQAESLLTSAQQQLAAEELNAAQLRNLLQVLVGGRLPPSLPDGLSLDEQAAPVRIDAGLPSDLLLARPDIVAAEETLRAARADIGAARAAFFPSISLTGTAGLASADIGGLFDPGDALTWTFGPSISLPIFDNGQRDANLALARATEAELLATYDRTVQTAFREVSDGLAGRRYLAEQVETLQRGVAAQQRIARIARLRYREGVADYLEVLDAERSLFSAQQQLLSTRRALYQNDVNLFVALGGGFGAVETPAP